MRKTIYVLVVMGSLWSWSCGSSQPSETTPPPQPEAVAQPVAEAPSPDAAQILDQAIAAAGGIDNLKKASTGTGKSEGVYMGMTYTSDNTYHPDQMRMEIKMTEQEPMSMVMGVETCWMTSGPVVVPCTEDDKKVNAHIMTMNKAMLLWPLKEGGWEVALGTPSGELQVLDVTHLATGGKAKLYIDGSTHLLVKEEYPGTLMGQPGTFVTELFQHKALCGAKIPTSTRVTFNQTPYLQEKVTEFECGEVNEAAFAAPAQVQDGTLAEHRVSAATVACHLHKGPYDQIGESFGKLMQFMAQEKLTPMGMPVMIYLKAPPKVKKPRKFETDVCFPVGQPAPPSPVAKGEFTIKGLESVEVLSIYGVGSPETKSKELAKKIVKEAKKRKLKPTGPLRQISYSDPQKTPPQSQVHELQLPVEKK